MSDKVRKLIKEKVIAEGYSLKALSEQIGRNHAYLQQFVERGVPRELPEKLRPKLARLLNIQPDELRSEDFEIQATNQRDERPDAGDNPKYRQRQSYENNLPDIRAWKLYQTLRTARMVDGYLSMDSAATLFRECLELSYKNV